MPLRLEAAADHEDWPDDELARLRGQHMAARDGVGSALSLLDSLPLGHPARAHHSARLATYGQVIAYTASRLRELGHPLPSERIAA